MKKLPDHVGHSYIYTPDLDSENQRSQRVRREESIGCCGCEETSLSRYTFFVGILFSMILGPYSGVQLVAGTQETDYYITAAASLILFLISLLMIGYSWSRHISRSWFLMGLIWIACSYIVYIRKDDLTEKKEVWLYISTIQAVVFFVFGLPIALTDPLPHQCLMWKYLSDWSKLIILTKVKPVLYITHLCTHSVGTHSHFIFLNHSSRAVLRNFVCHQSCKKVNKMW